MKLADALSGATGPGGVLWVLRGAPHRDILRPELGGLLQSGSDLGPCRLRRAKFKPGRKLAAYYDVEVRSPEGGTIRRPVAVTWPAMTEQADDEPGMADMVAEARRAGLATPFAKLQAVAAASGLRILVSPLDSRFPQLVRVSDPRHVRDMLAEKPPIGRAARHEAVRVSVVRYRPGQRHVLRYDPEWHGDGAGPSVFAKVYRNGNAQPAFRLATTIGDWLAARGCPVAVAAPFRLVAADDVVLIDAAPGRPLSLGIAPHGPDLAAPLRRAGAALRLMQGAPAAFTGRIPPHRFETEIETIARTSVHIQVLLPDVGRRVRAILERASALHERLPPEAPVFAHGDYKADHLFVHGDRLTLIDFDTCALADPALDLGKLMADLAFWHALSGRRGLAQAERAFLEGYGPAPPHRLRRARLYEALVLTKIAAHRLPVFSPTWGPDATRIIAAADALIERLKGDVRASARPRAVTPANAGAARPARGSSDEAGIRAVRAGTDSSGARGRRWSRGRGR